MKVKIFMENLLLDPCRQQVGQVLPYKHALRPLLATDQQVKAMMSTPNNKLSYHFC